MATIEQREAMYRDACETHRRAGYAEGYKAGRIAALREVGCVYGCARYADKRNYCSRCRLLAEAESEAGEVGG